MFENLTLILNEVQFKWANIKYHVLKHFYISAPLRGDKMPCYHKKIYKTNSLNGSIQ